jgi:hypothetical protein
VRTDPDEEPVGASGRTPTLRFRSSLTAVWKWASIVSSVGAALIYLAALAYGQVLPVGIGFALAGFLAVLLSLAVAVYPVYVRPDGLRSYDLFGVYHTVAWGEVVSARRERVFGLAYLVATSASGVRLWLPLYLKEMPDFARAVTACASEGNPLVAALDEQGW